MFFPFPHEWVRGLGQPDLGQLAEDQPGDALMEFGELRRGNGFDDYYETSERYGSSVRGVSDAK